MAYEFARGLIDFGVSEIIKLAPRQIENLVPSNDGDVTSFAVEYISVHAQSPCLRPIDAHFAKFFRTFDQATLAAGLFLIRCLRIGQLVDRFAGELLGFICGLCGSLSGRLGSIQPDLDQLAERV